MVIVDAADLAAGRRVADSVVGESEAEQARHQRARFVGCDDALDRDVESLQHRRQDVVRQTPVTSKMKSVSTPIAQR